jgi:hypothetical protein
MTVLNHCKLWYGGNYVHGISAAVKNYSDLIGD